ncbi:hypothetical protein BVX98_03990 [bacterium F11]|nr:hypothetical protein BVX98_03990 [bacterium F11]
MHLKMMHIVGFKSFADPVKLDFEPGMATVVGPNGCGKSNIIDAFRWCLGEMSAKSLRSNLMMDVIFNGSGARPPQNMAEVTLTFDNTDKKLPIDYSDVSISRRLFRSGESEYFINKTQCRLRDIRELFLDTGMGEDGYSSMEQGKVEWVLQAKPEQRRELFEEAAGVSKYRARREEAVRKLDRVEIDLSRINDIVSVTKDQIRKLENAVSRVKTYERIQVELKEMEISDWLAQLQEIEELLKQNQAELENKQNNFERLNTLTHKMEADLVSLRDKMAQTEEELLTVNGVLAGIDADIKIGEERLSQSQQREQELKQQIQTTQEHVIREEERLKELEARIEGQQSALQQFQASGEGIELAYKDSEVQCQKALENLESKQNEIKLGRETILEQAQERARLQQEISRLTSDVSRYQSQIENNQKEQGRLQQEIENFSNSLAQIETQKEEHKLQLSDKSSIHENFTRELSNNKSDEQNYQDKLFLLTEEMAKLKGQIHSIEEQQNQDPFLFGTNAVLRAQLQGIHGPIGRLFECDDSDRDIISAAIGEHLGDLIAERNEDAERAIEFLNSQGKGRVRIWILEKLPVVQPTSFGLFPDGQRLFDRIRCDNKFEPLLAFLCSNLWVKGSTIYGEAIINGGIDPSKWQSHVSMRLPELQLILHAKEDSKSKLDLSLSELSQNIAEKTLNKEALVKDLEEARVRFELAQEEALKINQRMALIGEEQKAVLGERDQLQEEQIKLKNSLEQHHLQFENLHQKEKDDHYQLDLRQQELTEFQAIHSNASADLSTKQEQFNSYQEKCNWHLSVVQHSIDELDGIRSNLQHHQNLVVQSEQEMETAKSAQGEANKLVQESLEKRKEASKNCEEIQTLRTQDADKIRQSESELSQVRGELNLAQEQVHNQKMEEAALKNRTESISQKLYDHYEMDFDKAKEISSPLKADPEKLDRLKKRVANIGPINLAAPQEHAELSEKNTFLTNQQQDLLKAKDDLRHVISKINATTKEHFRETFDKVRHNFRILYSQLFQGGDADLRLTDESDILSSGIDIFCQPPGKKLLHISLLSGGEKALTACALLFAFFQVRPSPVALLDEVDAPLDEANVLRYVDMLRTFNEKTQFLIITHNKRTMEAANTLYGVTMEEFGVSKILSARLQKEKQTDEAPVKTEVASV